MEISLSKPAHRCIRCYDSYIPKDNDEGICEYCARVIRSSIFDSLTNQGITLINLFGTYFEKYLIWK